MSEPNKKGVKSSGADKALKARAASCAQGPADGMNWLPSAARKEGQRTKVVKLCQRNFILFYRRYGNSPRQSTSISPSSWARSTSKSVTTAAAWTEMPTLVCHRVQAQLPWGQEPQSKGKGLAPT